MNFNHGKGWFGIETSVGCSLFSFFGSLSGYGFFFFLTSIYLALQRCSDLLSRRLGPGYFLCSVQSLTTEPDLNGYVVSHIS